MAINFPASLDDTTSLPNPTSSSAPSSPSHAGLHDNENAAIIAVESKIGTGSSTPTSGKLLVGTGTGTSSWTINAPTGTIVGTTDTQTLTNKTLTSPTINSPIITNANITTNIITGFTASNTGTIYGVGITGGAITGANSVNGSAIVPNTIPGTAFIGGSVSGIKLGLSLATNFIHGTNVTQSTTTSATPVAVANVPSLVVNLPVGGTGYLILGQVFLQSLTTTSNDVYAILAIDGSLPAANAGMHYRPVGQYNGGTIGLNQFYAASSGNHTFQLQYYATGGATVGIYPTEVYIYVIPVTN